jgi:hypothetical protein
MCMIPQVPIFLIARSIHPISWGSKHSVKMCNILLEISYKVYVMIFYGKFENTKMASWSPIGESFWQNDSLITHILFELCLFRNLAQCNFFLLTL